MSRFILQDPKTYSDNIFRAFAEDWALITVKNKEGKVNAMIGGWGGIGVMWGRPVFTAVIRPQRYTFAMAQESDYMTLSFFDGKYRDELQVFGSKSGRDMDKFATTGLAVEDVGDYAYCKEAEKVLVGRKLYVSRMEEANFLDKTIPQTKYAAGDYHYVYTCEIEAFLKRT